jgi:hypothetical protein
LLWAVAVMTGLAGAVAAPGSITAARAQSTASATSEISTPGTHNPAGAARADGTAGSRAAATVRRPALTRISSDPFTDTSAQHATEADPSISSYGSTVVAAFDQGLFADGSAASGIGFATSHDAGRTWFHGSLPGITTYAGG